MGLRKKSTYSISRYAKSSTWCAARRHGARYWNFFCEFCKF